MRTILGSLVLLAVFSAAPARGDYTATVDPAARYQTVEGWGTSLCWWANVAGGYPDAVRRDLLDKIFDSRKGLGLNIARYNIGGGENPNIPNTLEARARVPGFEPSAGLWDWKADANQRRILLEARRRGVTLEEAFANSPPYWMTISGSVTGAPNGGSNLRPQDFDLFADYLAEVVKHYRETWGVTFRTLEPMNESADHWWKKGGSQEGYHLDARNARGDDQNTLVPKVAAALRRRGLSTVVAAPDENTVDTTLASVGAYDDAARAVIGQINTHTYGGRKRAGLRDLAARLGTRLWVSEHGDGDATGMTLSQDILADLKEMGATAWVYWQAVDGGGWGLLSKDNNQLSNYAYTFNQKYFVLAQYSKFIRPGFRIIGVDDAHSLAAYQQSRGTLVIVTTNSGKSDTTVTYDLSRFRHTPRVAAACRTSPSETLAELPPISMSGGRLTAVTPAGSVTTFVLRKIF